MIRTVLTAAAIAVLTPILLLVRVWDDLVITYDADALDEEAS